MAISTESFIEPSVAQVTEQGVEAWALAWNRLHPKVVEFLQPLFGDDLDLSTVRLIVYPKNTSWLHTTVWVLGDKIVFRKLHLNQEFAQWRVDKDDGRNWYKSNGAIDLAVYHGMVTLAHELRHVWQSRSLPWWKQWWRFGWGIMKSLWYERRLYSHNQVWQEQDAIEFQHGLASQFLAKHKEGLKQFETLR